MLTDNDARLFNEVRDFIKASPKYFSIRERDPAHTLEGGYHPDFAFDDELLRGTPKSGSDVYLGYGGDPLRPLRYVENNKGERVLVELLEKESPESHRLRCVGAEVLEHYAHDDNIPLFARFFIFYHGFRWRMSPHRIRGGEREFLIAVWLLSDPEAHNSSLKVTKFEQWPWHDRCGIGRRVVRDELFGLAEGDADRIRWWADTGRSCLEAAKMELPHSGPTPSGDEHPVEKHRGGRPPITGEEASRRWAFFDKVTAGRERGETAKQVGQENGYSHADCAAILRWCRTHPRPNPGQ